MKPRITYAVLAIVLSSGSCGPIPDLRALSEVDLQPPVLLDLAVSSPEVVELSFQEPAEPLVDSFVITPTIAVSSIDCTDTALLIRLAGSMTAGQHYFLQGTVQDSRGNRLKFITDFFGYNDEIPILRINEFTTRGSGKHPDVVEILVVQPGDLAGLCLFEGTAKNWSDRLIFPSLRVEAGDFILVHFKPQGSPEEVDETQSQTESGGYDAMPEAWDFWVRGGDGISGNNGVLALYTHPSGDLIDGVLYSDRTSESDERYRGFGSRDVMERADELGLQGGWVFAGSSIAPEDAVNPSDSTGTRSICRDSLSTDGDSRLDWHTVPTRGSTFGAVNSDDMYDQAH